MVTVEVGGGALPALTPQASPEQSVVAAEVGMERQPMPWQAGAGRAASARGRLGVWVVVGWMMSLRERGMRRMVGASGVNR